MILDDPSFHLHANMLLCYSYHLKIYYFRERFFPHPSIIKAICLLPTVANRFFLTKTANLFVVFAPGVAKACIVVPPYFIYCHFSLKLDVNSLISENCSVLSRCCSTIALFQICLSRSGLKVISDSVLLRDLSSICLTVDAISSKPSG